MSEPKVARPDDDPHFIGWLPVPAAYRRFLMPVVAVLLLGAAGMAATIAYLQRNPGTGVWDTDRVSTFDGLVFTGPYAMMLVPGERPGDPPRTLLLVEAGKFGAVPRVDRVGGRGRVEAIIQGREMGLAARATGTLLQRDGRAMLELAEGEDGLRRLTREEEGKLPRLALPQPQVLAERTTLQGEIIDPKCYLGAMKPGGGKTHKACAMLCISGGIPPMLVVREAGQPEAYYLLTTADRGPANGAVLPFVGEPVAVTGRLERHGGLRVLAIGANGIQLR